jgi:hypothetical protein
MLSNHPICIKPSIFHEFENLAVGQSTRHGGVSTAPYASLNLGLYTQDGDAEVMENRRRFFAALGFEESQTAGSHQVHGDEINLVETPGQVKAYDALITNKKGILLTATIADCVPVLIYDPINEACAAIHAGWKGTRAKIVSKTLSKMTKEFGTKAENCYAYIGACISECSFEVDEDVAQFFDSDYKRWDEEKQKFFIDLKACNRSYLLALGVPTQQIETSPYCTVLQNEHFFSYRAEKGKTGRMLAAIGIKK